MNGRLVFFFTLLLHAPSAFAGERAAADPVTAQVFFERGREAASRGDAAAACRFFEESLRLDLAVGTLFNLAQCEEEIGRLASAWLHLREGIERLEDQDPRRAPAEASAADLSLRVPRLEVRLASSGPARVFRDGVELSTMLLGSSLPVNPGKHVIAVTMLGHADATYDVTLREGERRALILHPGAAVGGSDLTDRPAPETGGWLSAAPLGSVGIGPSPTAGGRVGFGLERDRTSLDLDVRIESTPGTVSVAGERVSLLVATGGLVPCLRFSIVRPCLFANFGMANGAASSVDAPVSRQSFTAFAGARIGVDVRLSRGVVVTPSLDAGLCLVRTRFEVAGAPVWTAPAFSGSLAVAVRARLF